MAIAARNADYRSRMTWFSSLFWEMNCSLNEVLSEPYSDHILFSFWRPARQAETPAGRYMTLKDGPRDVVSDVIRLPGDLDGEALIKALIVQLKVKLSVC